MEIRGVIPESTYMTILIVPRVLGAVSSAIMAFMKRRADYSQHFLRSPRLVEELVRRAHLKKTDTVYDIGAGSGVISSVLARHVAQVIAVEYEPKTVELLKKNSVPYSNIKVLEADILTTPFPRDSYKIVANIPFHISSKIVRSFLHSSTSPEAAYLIVQRQFGQKLISTDAKKFTSQLGMLLGAEYKIKIIKSLRKTDFWPHPAVDTVFMELIKRPQPLVAKQDMARYIAFTERCFANPKELAKAPLHIIGATPGLSPSRLTLDQWILLFNSQIKR